MEEKVKTVVEKIKAVLFKMAADASDGMEAAMIATMVIAVLSKEFDHVLDKIYKIGEKRRRVIWRDIMIWMHLQI